MKTFTEAIERLKQCTNDSEEAGYPERAKSARADIKTISAALKAQRRALKSAQGQLKTVREDCVMALEAQWDRSDDGFKAMQENCEKTITLIDKALAA